MKKIQKRIISLLLIFMSITLLVGCTNSNVNNEKVVDDGPDEDVTINVASLKGPTTIGLASMIEEYKDNDDIKEIDGTTYNIDYKFDVLGMPEEVVSGLNKGEIDMAAIPANLASTLYNKTDGEIKVAAINTLGVLHIIENGDSISEPSDLSGKTIYSIGKGTTPEGVLSTFIEKNELSDVNVEYKNEASEIAALLNNEEDIIAMIPEPFVSVVESKNDSVRRVFDMNEEWEKINDDSMVTGVLVMRDEFIKENPELVENFLSEYESSIDNAINDVENIAPVVEELEIIPEGFGEKSIPNISMEYIDGEEMEEILTKYLKDLYDFKPELIGGNMPGEDFYYKK